MGIVEVKLIREIIWILGLDVQLEEAMAVVKKIEILRTLRYVKKNRLKIIIEYPSEHSRLQKSSEDDLQIPKLAVAL